METDTITRRARGEVLVVDDTPDSRTYLCDLLGEHGYAVRDAPDGELALWTATSRRPDLILLDQRMPDMDGVETCRRLKSDPRTADVPVIFVSAQSDADDRIRGFEAGAVDYIAKPFSAEEVLHRVAAHIRLVQLTHELAGEKAMLEVRVRERTAQLEEVAAALRQEIASHRNAREKLRLAACAFDASLSCMFITDASRTIVAINRAFGDATGYAQDECIGRPIGLLNSGKHDDAFFAQIWKTVEIDGKWSGEMWNRRKDGNEFPCLSTISTVTNEKGAVRNYVGVFVDLSEAKDAQTLIEFLTQRDPLTGLANRLTVRDRFNQSVTTLGADETMAVTCVNLNRFRLINDAHGYTIGNEVLQWMAEQLSDLLSPMRDDVFRESGDEFVFVRRERGSAPGIRPFIESLLTRLNTEVGLDGIGIDVTASIGVALYPADGTTLEELIANASIAMERAKKHGDPYAFFAEQTDRDTRERFNLARRLRHALARGEFEVYYQPQVGAGSGHTVAAEALLRWNAGDLGHVSPGQFIPVAEESGHIVAIGTWVLRTVCAQIAAWDRLGLGRIRVAVNLSARQFMRHDLCEVVRSALAESGIAASSIELEITESAIIENVERAIAVMRELKSIGVSIALDDFGTGYSSLSYLKRFPIDCIKIDQSFVRDIFDGDNTDAIVLSIIALAHHMHMQVVAEGVETKAQRDFLAANGCELMQGYLFSKPVRVEEFTYGCRQEGGFARCVA